ncbi:MAG: glycosyltransferase, partial [Vicinamibacteria bacterium]
ALRPLCVVVLSRYMRDELVAAGLDGGRVSVVPPFVRPFPPARADEPPCVLFAGRLVEAKGVRDAIEAWRIADLGVPLVAAGAGPLREELEHAGAFVTGWVGRGGLAALFARAGALVLPSRWQEPFGIVGLEALTCGVPVAAWESGGVAEWHPGPGLAPWGDTSALGRALRAAFGTRAEAPAGFEPGPLMARLHAVYEDAARRP